MIDYLGDWKLGIKAIQIVFFCGFLLISLNGISSQENDVRSFHAETEIHAIEIPVQVLDRKSGKAIENLKKEDFRVFEDGELQTITNFTEINLERATGETEKSEGLRQIIYFFDLFLMKPQDRDLAVRELRKHYTHGASPRERISIVSYDGEMHHHLDSSREKAAFSRALDEVQKLKAHGISQRIAFTQALADEKVSGERKLDYYERRQRSREFMGELQRRVEMVEAAISTVLGRFSSLKGRRILIIFSPGQPETSWNPSYAPVDYINGEVAYPAQDLWNNLALSAADLGYSMYVVDSSGPVSAGGRDSSVSSLEIPGRTGGRGRQEAIQAPNGDFGENGEPNGSQDMGQWIERTRKNMLLSSTKITGGHVAFSAEIDASLEKIETLLKSTLPWKKSKTNGGTGTPWPTQ